MPTTSTHPRHTRRLAYRQLQLRTATVHCFYGLSVPVLVNSPILSTPELRAIAIASATY